ncbi:MAG: ATP-binding cassette domain-containing protein [Brachybacterium sp.]|uniref:ABC-F family ATP-binding cassette domain-containing protein n=1 Tax=Brachybacterium sp. TaxID=1891286 RepID=UPI00264772E8|nr:ABC-F family ATP-binding cassette domain-containing protein [Brachybacterium sp.]MDN5685976.1 ATP-binding cassette domain-containing protein [Brachybacterium sp.]
MPTHSSPSAHSTSAAHSTRSVRPARSSPSVDSASSAAPAGLADFGDPRLHLRADGLSVSYPDRRVLTDVSLVVPAGRPTGLLGENGSGKSTLLRILAGDLVPDTGTASAPGPVGVLHQELPAGPTTALADVVADALERSRRLERELAAAGEALAADDGEPAAQAARRYDELLAEAALADVWNADRRAETVLAGLSLDGIVPATPLGEISGGQRERLALAHLLISRPTTWLLDEPTNHVDDDGAAFLTATIAAHGGPVLVASHDRAFLDDATAAQLDLDPAESPARDEPGGLTLSTGGFSDYLVARFAARDRWEQRFRAEQDELKDLRQAVKDSANVGHDGAGPRTEARASKKFYADRNATVVSRRLREARARLAQLEQDQIRKPPAELHFTHLPPVPGRGGSAQGPGAAGGAVAGGGPAAGGGRGAAGGVLLTASELAVDGRLGPVSFSLSAGEHLLVTGANGSGKSTLLETVTGHLAPTHGTVDRPRGLRIGHLGQDDAAFPGRTVGEHLREAAAGAHGSPGAGGAAGAGRPSSEDDAVPELFGLVHPRDLTRPLELLSRGQLRRVMLAALLLDPPELLVLDEPTNHLALVTATRFESALADWPGTVLIASHDRWLRSRWQGELLALSG